MSSLWNFRKIRTNQNSNVWNNKICIFHKQQSVPEQVWEVRRVNISITEKYKALLKIEVWIEGGSMKKSVADKYE